MNSFRVNLRVAKSSMLAVSSLGALASATSVHAQSFDTVERSITASQPTNPTVAVPRAATILHRGQRSVISVKSDGLVTKPMLNATVEMGGKRLAFAGYAVTFQTYWNYTKFIKRGEIRLFVAGETSEATPFKILSLDAQNQAAFTPSLDGPQAMFFVLRVYDGAGNFDETRPRELTVAGKTESNAEPADAAELVGRDNTAKRNIVVRGGTVTVSGQDVDPSSKVNVLGQLTPISEDGRFIAQQVVPFGRQDIQVRTRDASDVSANFAQEINIPKNDWFTVAIGEITLGSSTVTGLGALNNGNDPEFDKLYLKTRGAVYAKGLIAGKTRITASLDTGETSIRKIFSNLDEKNPAQLLRRLDSTLYYPSYGDDSTTVEDAPTQGRFYVRVDRDDNKFVLGNFVLEASGTDLAQLDRGLYGAMGDYVSTRSTSFGERTTRITAFAADPGTAPAREEFRGTGGSAYFLQRQDLSIGSERLRVEIRDKDSGLVLESRDLRPQEDYDIDYIQGRVLLTRPLSASSDDGQTVRTGIYGGNLAVLVVRYEYTPTVGDLGGYTFGGRATHWLGNIVRFGATAQREATASADQMLLGADILVRKSAATYFKAEVARSDGPGFGQANSVDGGLNFATLASPGQRSLNALSWRAEGALELSEIIRRTATSSDSGKVSGYFEHLGAGFSGAGRLTLGNVDRWGSKITLPLTPTTNVTADYDETRGALQGGGRAVDLGIEQILGHLKAKLGFRHERRQANNYLTNIVDIGARNDLALQLTYDISPGANIFAFGQSTLDHVEGGRGNSRYGIGGRYEVSNRVSLNGEVSEGEGGFGATVGATRRIGENSESYLNYSVSTERSDSGFEAQSLLTRSNYGTLTIGGRTRFRQSLTVHGEERLGMAQRSREFVHSYGLEFTPGSHWSFSGTFENGRITDRLTGSFDRTAATASVGFSNQGLRIASSLEGRIEAGLNRNQTSWLSRTTVGLDADPSWRLLGRLNLAISDADHSSLLDAGFVEGVVGFAYRPVANNRVNALFKYTYLRDVATLGQITSGGATSTPKQRSQILSADFSYNLTNWLTIGGKYGFRFGEMALSRGSDTYVSSTAQLGIARADLHMSKKWDVLVEGRYLSLKETQDGKLGLLGGIYRDVGKKMKIGAGYSFSAFSDDLTNLDYRSKGLFLNFVGLI